MTQVGAPAAGSLSRRHRPRRVEVVLAVAAVLLGVLAELLGFLPTPWLYLSQVIYPWLLGAFACGAVARSWVRAAAFGVCFIVAGLASNITFKWVMYGYASVRPMLENEWPAWLAMAVILGCGYGVAGWVHATRGGVAEAIAAAVLVASGLTEAAANVAGVLPWGGWVGGTVAALVTVSAAILLRRRPPRQLLATAFAVLALTLATFALLPVLADLITVA